MSNAEERVAEAWSSNHAYLTNLAFGILGDLGAAEDAVQEAFARLVAADVDGIMDDRGWLTVVTSRICFDKVRSAPRRREFGYEDTTLETMGNPLLSPGADNPLDRITLDDEVRLALLVMLHRLSPAERVVFVLHDVFQMPFDTIAQTVGRPAPSCRQLARRARLKFEDGGLVHPPIRSTQNTGWSPRRSLTHARVGTYTTSSNCSTPRWPVTSTLVRGIQRLDRSIVDQGMSLSISFAITGVRPWSRCRVNGNHSCSRSMGGDLLGSSPWRFDGPEFLRSMCWPIRESWPCSTPNSM